MGNSKSLFCLSCIDDKNTSFISTHSNIVLQHPKSEINPTPTPRRSLFFSAQGDSKSVNLVQPEEHKTNKEEIVSSIFVSFITEEKQANSFHSSQADRLAKEEEERLRTSILMRKSVYRQNLIENVFKLITASYDGFECILNDNKSNTKLKIYLNSYIKSKSRVNIFRTEYIAPCLPKEYLEFANNLELQRGLDHASENYYVVKNLNEGTDILYLSYKKTIITSPRDFLYMKTYGEICKENINYYCIVGKSLELEEFPTNPNIIRCEIINSGYLIEACEEGSLIRTYSEFDFKINIPLFIVKNFSVGESKKFVENSISKLKEVLAQKKI